MIEMLVLAMLVSMQDAATRAGVEAYRAGDYAGAVARFEESLRQKETADAWTSLGHARAALGENGAARRAYERSIALGTTEKAKVSLALGRVLILDNAAAAAAEALAPALDAPETAGDAWLLLAHAQEALGRRAAAVDAYRQAAARRPRNAPLRARLAQLLLEIPRTAEALEVIAALIEESPANPDWRLLRAQAALRAGDGDEAEAALQSARLLGADRPALRRTLGDLHLAQGRGREAAAHYRAFLASGEPVTPEDRLRMGLALLQAGEFASAEQAIRHAAGESDACRRGLVALARALSEKRGAEPALEALASVPADSSAAGSARLLKAQILLREGRGKEAVAALTDAWDRGERSREFLAAYLDAIRGSDPSREKTVRADALARFPEEPRFLNAAR